MRPSSSQQCTVQQLESTMVSSPSSWWSCFPQRSMQWHSPAVPILSPGYHLVELSDSCKGVCISVDVCFHMWCSSRPTSKSQVGCTCVPCSGCHILGFCRRKWILWSSEASLRRHMCESLKLFEAHSCNANHYSSLFRLLLSSLLLSPHMYMLL